MVDRIKITPSEIVTRDAANNITFSTNYLYLKTDPTGTMSIGGWVRQPVYGQSMSATATNQVLTDMTAAGHSDTILDMSYSTIKLRMYDQATWYEMYVPSGITEWASYGGYTIGTGGPPAGLFGDTWNMMTIKYKANYTDSWTTVTTTGEIFGQTYIQCMDPPYCTYYGAGPKKFGASVSSIDAAYQQYGSGYYHIEMLPTDWNSRLSTSQSKTPSQLGYGQDPYSENIIVVPKINIAPTNISVAVTP